MKKGQVYEATVERVDFPAKGIAQTGEGAIVVKNSLPGQKIKLSVSKVRNGKAEGRLLEVLEQSPLETSRPCSHFGVCGGCTYLSLPYEEQLKIKEEQVRRLLDACLSRQDAAWTWEGIKGSPEAYEYRNKMEFTFGDEVKDGPLSLGMHKRGSFYDVVTVGDCRIVDEDYRLILRVAREYFADAEARYFHRLSHEGYLRHLLVRKAARTGEILVALVTTSQDPWGGRADGRCGENVEMPSKELSKACGSNFGEACDNSTEEQLLAGFLKAMLDLEHDGRLKGRFAGILHIVNDSQADVVRSDRTDVLYGQDYFYEELLGLRFKISVFSFFQTNTHGAEVLYETAREYVGEIGNGHLVSAIKGCAGGIEGRSVREHAGEARNDSVSGGLAGEIGNGSANGEYAGEIGSNCQNGGSDKVIFDLYSGTGTIAQLMAPVAGKVIGVEIVEEAVLAARRNAEENGLGNCEFIAGDVLRALDVIEEKPDFIILDPPRDGIHPKALSKIISYGVDRILYISCKPTSLVRDLQAFLENGYVVQRAVAVDQFPWTANVETVCLLGRRKPDTKVRIDVDLEDYYRIKDAKKTQN